MPGPNHHIWSTDLPAYEFPTGDATARVLARRLHGQSEWLICAWAADGADRNVSVTIPDLGTVTVLARATGTVYRAKPGPVLTLIDTDGLHPTAALHNITATNGPNGAISSSGYVVVPTGASETFIFTPNPGYQVANVLVDGVAQGPQPSYTFTNVTANHTINVTFTTLVFTVTPPTQATVNSPVTLTATATGVAAPEYKFYALYLNNGINQQLLIQDYSASSSCTWIPTVPQTYTLVACVRAQGSTVACLTYAAKTGYLVTLTPVTAVTLSSTPASPVSVNTPITLAATATGGDIPQFKFYALYLNSSGQNQQLLIQDYSASSTCIWTPTVPQAYTLVVCARSLGETVVADVYATSRFVVTPLVNAAVSLSISPSSPTPVGTPITLKAAASGVTAPQYEFYALYPDSSGQNQQLLIQAYSASSTCSWTPTQAQTYTLVVCTRAQGETIPDDAYAANAGYVVTPLAPDRRHPQPLDTLAGQRGHTDHVDGLSDRGDGAAI